MNVLLAWPRLAEVDILHFSLIPCSATFRGHLQAILPGVVGAALDYAVTADALTERNDMVCNFQVPVTISSQTLPLSARPLSPRSSINNTTISMI